MPFTRPFAGPKGGAARFANGRLLLFLGCAHGGAHCKTVCTRNVCKPMAPPLARGLRGRDPPGNAIGGRAGAPRPPPARAPRRLLANGGAMGLHTFRVQTVLQCAPPCAHPRKGIGFAIGTAHRKNLPTWQKARQKALPSGSNFFQLFFSPPLRGPAAYATLATVSSGPGLPKRRG